MKHSFLLKPTLLLSSCLGYGGWGAFQWDESLTLQKRTWGGQIKILGMHTWIFKQFPFQAGLQLAVSKRF
jgi:hypothetical protein